MSRDNGIDLSDAKALLARAQSRYDEFESLVRPENTWNVRSERNPDTGEWSYRIEVCRAVFDEARFTIVDCANYTASALDHIAAAIAKSIQPDRVKLYFPWGFAEDDFERNLASASKLLGPELPNVLRDARKRHWMEIPHMQAAKQIANDGKHWELRAVEMGGVGIAPIGKNFDKPHFALPADAFAKSDSYEFHRGPELDDSRGYELWLGLKVDGLKEGLPDSTWTIFNCAFRFVQGMIEAVEQHRSDQSEGSAESMPH